MSPKRFKNRRTLVWEKKSKTYLQPDRRALRERENRFGHRRSASDNSILTATRMVPPVVRENDEG